MGTLCFLKCESRDTAIANGICIKISITVQWLNALHFEFWTSVFSIGNDWTVKCMHTFNQINAALQVD